jgi:endoglucanase
MLRPVATCLAVLLSGMLSGSASAEPYALTPFSVVQAPEIDGLSAAEAARSLGRGASLGGVLEAPSEGAWGLFLTPEMFKAVAEGGFDTIRLPARFSNHAETVAPYRLDEAFARRVDFAVNQALSNGLKIIIDFHHYHQMDGDPLDPGEVAAELSEQQLRERFVAIWGQLAERYQSLPNDRVFFELYNEPHGTTAAVWNELLATTLDTVRKTNPYRFVLIDPVNWSTPSGLAELRLPAEDRRLIVAVHSYEPYHFTMQGAPWIEGSASWRGTTCCEEVQLTAMTAPLDVAVVWSIEKGRPVILGEFGSNSLAPHEDRVRYTRLMREAAEARDFSWSYWDFASEEFGPWNGLTQEWLPDLHRALIPAE